MAYHTKHNLGTGNTPYGRDTPTLIETSYGPHDGGYGVGSDDHRDSTSLNLSLVGTPSRDPMD